MSAGLEAIANELRRLKRDGVGHVFVEDDTLNMLKPNEVSAPRPPSPQINHSDLTDLVGGAPESQTKGVKAQLPPAVSQIVSIPDSIPVINLPEGDANHQLTWLEEQILACPVCNEQLSDQGKIVFGTGNPAAEILFCGEAPGADEEVTGKPFVGKAGQLLSKIISAMGLSSEEVYSTNILKWRPKHDKPYGNRPPSIEEMRYCLPYLEAQIEIIQPKLIVALGNTVVSGLLGPDNNRKMATIRGTWASFAEIPLMITFHPSYLLRNGTLKTKRLVWEDMLKVMEKCKLEISEKQRGYFLTKS